MSRLEKFLRRPKISRLITFGVVVILIGVSAYFAYKRGVFASVATGSTQCTVKLADGVQIKYDDTVGLNADGTVQQNGEKALYILQVNSSGQIGADASRVITNENRSYPISVAGTYKLHGQASRNSVSDTYKQIYSDTFSCLGGNTITITKANLNRPESGQGITFQATTPAGSGNSGENANDLVCTKHLNMQDLDNPGTYSYSYIARSVAEASNGNDYEIVADSVCTQNGVTRPTTGNGGSTGGGTGTTTTHCINYYGSGTNSYEGTYTLSGSTYTRTVTISGNPPASISKTTVEGDSTKFSVSDAACQAAQSGSGSGSGSGARKCAHIEPNVNGIWVSLNSSNHWVSSDGRYDFADGDISPDYTSGASNYFMSDSGCSNSAEPASNTPGQTTTSSLQLKCVKENDNIMNPGQPSYSWYYKNNNGKWQNYSNPGTEYDEGALRLAESEASCSTKPTQAPANAQTSTTATGAEPASNTPTFNGDSTTATNASGVTWKCLQIPATSNYAWYFKTKSGTWQNKDNSSLVVTDSNARSLEAPVKNCGTAAPTDKPTTANATTTTGAEPGANANAGQTAGASLGDNPSQISIPVAGLSQAEQATLKKGKAIITAYRYSQAGTAMANGYYAKVGGAKLRMIGEISTSDKVTIPDNNLSSDKVFNTGTACGGWNTYKTYPALRTLFKNTTSFEFMTPENGKENSTTNLLELPVGIYTVQAGEAKTGLYLKNKFCFSVKENETVNLNVLLEARSGAEPPAVSGNVSYERTQKGVNRYFANGLEWMYIPQYPALGWQKVQAGTANNGYNTNTPAGYNSEGGIVPGIDPTQSIPGGSMAQLMSLCQQAGITASGSIDTGKLTEIGAVFGFLTGSGSITDRLGSAAVGLGAGWIAEQLFGGKSIDFSINLNTISDQCRYLQQVSIPYDCAGCLNGGYCPPGCMANNSFLQGVNYLTSRY